MAVLPAVPMMLQSGRRRVGQNRAVTPDPLPRLRRLCLALPETSERRSHGEPTWFVGGRTTFVMYADHHHDDRVACWCAAPAGAQRARVAEDPHRFFAPPYVGGRGWVGVWLDVPVNWDQMADLVADAYQTVAPKRLVAALDRRGPATPAPAGRERPRRSGGRR
jgi:hypothetical protein